MIYETDPHNATSSNSHDNYDFFQRNWRLRDHNWDIDNFRSNRYQCTAMDFIHTLIKTSRYVHSAFTLKETVSNQISVEIVKYGENYSSTRSKDLSLDSFLAEINYSPMTLNLAFNLLLSFELPYEQKELLKQKLMASRYVYNDIGDIPTRPRRIPRSSKTVRTSADRLEDDDTEVNMATHLHALMQHVFFAEEEKITSWQVRVRIVDIKHLVVGTSLGQVVYCIIEIGDKHFRTRDKQVDALKFDDDDEVSKYFSKPKKKQQ